MNKRNHSEDLGIDDDDDVFMDLRETEWSGLDTSGLGQGLVAGSCEHGNEPLEKAGNFLTS
jgi:hypothetical protein